MSISSSRFYASLALQELINEVPIHEVASKFKVNRGILQCLQQNASLFAGIVTAFCNALNWDLLGLLVSQFKERLFFGVHRDILDIMKIPIINSQRARALFKAGFHTLADLSNSDLLSVEKCLYDSISFDIKKRDGESKYDEEQRNFLRLVFITGKAGLTVSEAARMIIEEARNYLQKEIGVSDAVWSHKNTDVSHEHKGNEMRYFPEETRVTKIPSNRKSNSKKLKKLKIENKTRGNIAANPIVNHDLTNVSVNNSNNLTNLDLLNNNGQYSIDTSSQNFNEAERSAVDSSIKIIDIFQSAEFFKKIYGKFHVFTGAGLSLAIDKRSDAAKVYNCMLTHNDYIRGVSLYLGENIVFYLNFQESDSTGLKLTEKISFLREVLLRSDFTLKVLDTREQLKKLFSCDLDYHGNCRYEDPKIAHWLCQSNNEPDYNEMVRINTHYFYYIMLTFIQFTKGRDFLSSALTKHNFSGCQLYSQFCIYLAMHIR